MLKYAKAVIGKYSIKRLLVKKDSKKEFLRRKSTSSWVFSGIILDISQNSNSAEHL